MDWYVIQAYSGYEQKVKNAIEERIELANMKDFFGEILVPTEQIVDSRAVQKRQLNENSFLVIY